MEMESKSFDNEMKLVKSVLDKFPAFIIVYNTMWHVVYHNIDPSVFSKKLSSERFKKSLEIKLRSMEAEGSFSCEMEEGEKWFRVSYSCVNWPGEQQAKLFVGFDITELKASVFKFIKGATVDAMTGIYNRQSGLDYLDKYIDDAKKGKIFTVCFIDINNLKYINDFYGHSKGDEYILTYVETIKGIIRKTDIFARMGGDEFLIILPECGYDVVDEIMATVASAFKLLSEGSLTDDIVYSISYGIMEVGPKTVLDPEYILNVIDSRMYEMKEVFRSQLRKNRIET